MVEKREGTTAVAMVAVVVHVDVAPAAAATKQIVPWEAAAAREGGGSLAAPDGRVTCVAQGDTALRAHQPWTTGANALCILPAVVAAPDLDLSAAVSHCRCSTRCHSQPLRYWQSYWSARTRALPSGSPGGVAPRLDLQRRSNRGCLPFPARSHFPRREPASLPRRRDFFAGTAALSAAKSVQGVAAAMAPPVILPLVFSP